MQTGRYEYVYGEFSADMLLEHYENGQRLEIEPSFNMSHSACHIVDQPRLGWCRDRGARQEAERMTT